MSYSIDPLDQYKHTESTGVAEKIDSPIGAQLRSLERMSANLETALNKLASSLSPALSAGLTASNPEAMKDGEKAVSEESPITVRLRDIVKELERTARRISDLNSRLEL